MLNVALTLFAGVFYPFPEMRNPYFWNGVLCLDIGLTACGVAWLSFWRRQLKWQGVCILGVGPVIASVIGLWRIFAY